MAKKKAMIVANDMGYSSIKADIDGEYVYQPSVVAEIKAYQTPNVESFEDQSQATDAYMSGFLEHMDVSIASSAISMPGRYFVGNAAVGSGIMTSGMDVYANTDKSETDMPVFVTLATIAAKAVKDAYEAGEDIFTPITAHVNMTTALPISESKSQEKATAYAHRYTDSTHTITFHNFKDPITVSLKFDDTYVCQEGSIAHLVFVNASDDFREGVREELKSNYGDDIEDDVLDSLLNAENTLSIDIGQGTTDFSVGIEGRMLNSASVSINQGYGSVLGQAMAALADKRINFSTAEKLMNFLSTKPMPWKKQRYDEIKETVYQQLEPLANEISKTVNRIAIAGDVNQQIDVIYVYGGGAVPMGTHSTLRQQLMTVAEKQGLGPVVFVPAKYSQKMNLMGLKMMAQFRSSQSQQ